MRAEFPIAPDVVWRRPGSGGLPATLVVLAGAASLLAACGEQANRQPSLNPIPDAQVRVGETLRIPLNASDPDGDALTYSVTPMPTTAYLDVHDGATDLVWSPLVSDTLAEGRTHRLTIAVDDGRGGRAQRDVPITVLPQIGPPVFVGPTGYVLNLSADDDISFLIQVKDDDSAEVTMTVIQRVEGAVITSLDRKTLSFYWKPSADQRKAGNYWPLVVEARDEIHPAVQRQYSILLTNADAAKSCAGTPPVIKHTALGDIQGSSTVAFRAWARDAETRVRELTVHWTTQNPLDPAAYTESLVLEPCDPAVDPACPADPAERYAIGLIQNPAKGAAVPVLLHYFLTAVDDDDIASTTCDKVARFPKAGHLTAAAEPAGWPGGCQDDIFEPNDTPETAVPLSPGVTWDLRSCDSSPVDFYRVDVTPGAVLGVEILHEATQGALAVSVHDALGSQVYPPEGTVPVEQLAFHPPQSPVLIRVGPPPGAEPSRQSYGLVVTRSEGDCPNDPFEPNDSPLQPAVKNRILLEKLHTRDVVICPGDRDVLKLPIEAEESLLVDLSFQHAFGDLDLRVLAADGTTVVAESLSDTNDEHVIYTSPVDTTLYIEVFGFQGAYNSGTLRLERARICEDDPMVGNQTGATAMLLPENVYSGLVMCPGTEDWFRLDMNGGETLTVIAAPWDPAVPVEIELFADAEGSLPAGTAQPAEDGQVRSRATLVEAGTLWWRVRGVGAEDVRYDMAFGVADPPGACQSDRFAPNDSWARAAVVDSEVGFVTRLRVCPDEHDWFSIQGKAFEELFVFVFGFPDEEPLNARLLRAAPDGESPPEPVCLADEIPTCPGGVDAACASGGAPPCTAGDVALCPDGNTAVCTGQGLSTTNGVELRTIPSANEPFYIHVWGAPGALHHYDLVIGLQ